jgi:hypothetical protein
MSLSRLNYGATDPVVLSGFRTTSLIALLMLVGQFLLGMWVNLFVTPPSKHPGVNAGNYFVGVVQVERWALLHSEAVLRAHVILGVLLGLGALGTLVQATRTHRRALVVWSVVGALAVLAAGFNGASFLNYGHDFSSMIMAAGFALAVVAYAAALYAAR